MSEKIKQCPLCGDDAHLTAPNLAQCNNWDCALGHVQVAVDKWNNCPQVDQLTAENVELRKDKERLDWLALNAAWSQSQPPEVELILPDSYTEESLLPEAARQAIDAARNMKMKPHSPTCSLLSGTDSCDCDVARNAEKEEDDPTIPPPVHTVIATMEYVPKEIADRMADALEEIINQDWIKTSAIARAGKDVVTKYRTAMTKEQTK